METINQIQIRLASEILAQQGETKQWGKREHLALLRKTAVEFGLPKEKAAAFANVIAENGLGANASQFRQWLERPSPKGPGLLPPPSAAGALADYA